MAEAAKADADLKAGKYHGPLHGIPYGVKDLFSMKGVRTTWGSKDFENRIIDEDAEVVVRLRNAGAVLIAKLATGLFAQGDQWYRGRTNNPWDIRRGSSGSSAGPRRRPRRVASRSASARRRRARSCRRRASAGSARCVRRSAE